MSRQLHHTILLFAIRQDACCGTPTDHAMAVDRCLTVRRTRDYQVRGGDTVSAWRLGSLWEAVIGANRYCAEPAAQSTVQPTTGVKVDGSWDTGTASAASTSTAGHPLMPMHSAPFATDISASNARRMEASCTGINVRDMANTQSWIDLPTSPGGNPTIARQHQPDCRGLLRLQRYYLPLWRGLYGRQNCE